MLHPLLGKEKSLKNSILHILSSEHPLTAKRVYNRIKREGFNVSYHAVYKAVKQLIGEGVLEKNRKQYTIKKEWIDQMKLFLTELENNSDSEKPSVEQLLSGDVSNITFTSLFEFYDYMMEFFTEFASRGGRKLYAHWYHLYWALSFEGERFVKFKNMINSFKVGYSLCKGKTKADDIIAEYYSSFKPIAYTKLGVDCAKLCDLFVCGDFIAQVFFEEKFKRKLDKAYSMADVKNQKSMRKLMEVLFFAKTKITVVVTRNRDLAEQIKKDTLRYFSVAYANHGFYKQTADNSITSMNFHTIYEIDKFLIEYISKLKPVKGSLICIYWCHSWIPLFLQRDVYKGMLEAQKKFKIYSVIKGDTFIDNWCNKFFHHEKIGVDLGTTDFLVLDDNVIEIYYPDALKKEIYKIYSSASDISDIDAENLFKTIFQKRTSIPVIVHQNKELAKNLKQKVIGAIRGNNI